MTICSRLAAARSAFFLLPVLLMTAACGGHSAVTVAGVGRIPGDWRQMATDDDRERLRNWRTAWLDGIDSARKAGHGAEIDAAGALFDPDNAIEGAVPPAGLYHCRAYKLGANGTAMADFVIHPEGECRVATSGRLSTIAKLNGQQRPSGVIFPDSPSRAIVLGTLMLGDETRMIGYGLDTKRDIIGFINHIAPKRWRLVLPSPHFESKIDVVDLVPVER